MQRSIDRNGREIRAAALTGDPRFPGARASLEPSRRRLDATSLPCSEREQRLLASLLHSLDLPLYVIDANTYEIVLANAAMCRDVPPWGVTCHSLTHHRDSPCSGTDGPCPLEAVRRTRRPVVVEHRHYDGDGRARHYEVHAVPVFDREGRLSEMIEYNVDVTERQRMEKQLRSHEHSLELLIQQLQLSNRELATFAALAADDIRAPLQSVSASAATLQLGLRDSAIDESTRHALATLMKGIQRLRDTITSWYERTRQSLRAEPATLDLNRLVSDLCRFQLAAEIRAASGRIHVEEPLHELRADEAQVLELLRTLISNALELRRPHDPPQIVVRTREIEDGWVRIEVEDNGRGIDHATERRIFDMFAAQSQPPRFSDEPSAGLAACKRIVQRHGGRIGVQSQYGSGSTFWVELPGRA